MAKMKLPSKDARMAVYEGTDKYESIQCEVVDEWRWGNLYEAVIQDKETEKYWSVTFRVQTGDNYYNELDEYDEVEFTEVKPFEKVTVEYRAVKD